MLLALHLFRDEISPMVLFDWFALVFSHVAARPKCLPGINFIKVLAGTVCNFLFFFCCEIAVGFT
jgi:hypothetical protein